MIRAILFLLCGFSVAWAQNPATAVFPAAVASDADLLVANNSAIIDLAADLAIDGMSVVVSDASRFTAPLVLTIEAEKIKVCSKLANTLTVCSGGRAFAGTAAAAHASGAIAAAYVEASGWNQTNAEVKAIETALGANLEHVVSPSTLAAWPGSSSVTALGTISSGTIPWGNVGSKPSVFAPSAHAASHGAGQSDAISINWSQIAAGVPSTFAPAAHAASHVQGAGDALSGTLAVSITGNAATVANGVYTNGSYSDPAWLTISKGKVGLGSVENTALSTWAGSASITTLGTIATGTVPAARISGAVATATALAADPADCAAGSAANGINASGTATECIAVPNRQINFAITDANAAIPANAMPVYVWSPDYASVTITQVKCYSDTGDAVIMVVAAGTNMLTANLTCGASYTSTTSFASPTAAQGAGVGYKVISGTAKTIGASIMYTGN